MKDNSRMNGGVLTVCCPKSLGNRLRQELPSKEMYAHAVWCRATLHWQLVPLHNRRFMKVVLGSQDCGPLRVDSSCGKLTAAEGTLKGYGWPIDLNRDRSCQGQGKRRGANCVDRASEQDTSGGLGVVGGAGAGGRFGGRGGVGLVWGSRGGGGGGLSVGRWWGVGG